MSEDWDICVHRRKLGWSTRPTSWTNLWSRDDRHHHISGYGRGSPYINRPALPGREQSFHELISRYKCGSSRGSDLCHPPDLHSSCRNKSICETKIRGPFGKRLERDQSEIISFKNKILILTLRSQSNLNRSLKSRSISRKLALNLNKSEIIRILLLNGLYHNPGLYRKLYHSLV